MGNYTLDQAQKDIAALRGTIAHLLVNGQFTNITTGVLKYSNIPVYHADCSSPLSVTASEADVTGATVSVVVRGNSSTVVVSGIFDMQTNASAAASVSGFLNWNGGDSTENALIQTGTATSMRATTAQTWVITGVTAGTYTAKLRASGTTGGTVRATHTGITAMVWEGP